MSVHTWMMKEHLLMVLPSGPANTTTNSCRVSLSSKGCGAEQRDSGVV
jgi:hypothetical protein